MKSYNSIIDTKVAGKRLRIIPWDSVIIWDEEVWDGKDQKKFDQLIETIAEDGPDYPGDRGLSMYDLSDGAPYYWNYDINEVVDAIDDLLFPAELIKLRGFEGGLHVATNGSTFELNKDGVMGEYLLSGRGDGEIYWLKQRLFSANGRLFGFLVAKA